MAQSICGRSEPGVLKLFRAPITAAALLLINLSCHAAFAANAPSFVEGYHGGIEGHYPEGTTEFIVDSLLQHPQWKLCLEIEPATWQAEKLRNPDAFQTLQKFMAKSPGRIELVSGAYSQPYFWNIGGESLIRQFVLGREEIRRNFPQVAITTYACEEPCWTSSMPQILKSLGYTHAVLKNPFTAYAGYCAGKDAETVQWVGPDGSSITAVPRYVGEHPTKTCWETQAAYNTPDYLNNAEKAGIRHPVGMCFQDAGWSTGPWHILTPSIYRTWNEYFTQVAAKPQVKWNLSQEDIQVSLVWGSQILQQIAQDVHWAENRILTTEKVAAMANLVASNPWPADDFREAWRTLLLSQHHDAWICPTNRHPAGSWALQVMDDWIPNTQTICRKIISSATRKLSAGQGQRGNKLYYRVINPVSADRSEMVAISLPKGWNARQVDVFNSLNEKVVSQPLKSPPGQIAFSADVPSLGFATYRIEPAAAAPASPGAKAVMDAKGSLSIITDIYRIVLDGKKGGRIKSLFDKKLHREFVDTSSPRGFNEYRGYSESVKAWISSADAPATLKIVENGPVRVVVTATGKIGDHPFVSTLTAVQGQKRLDMNIHIEWIDRPYIGKPWNGENVRYALPKPFYNDRYKLQAIFPCDLKGPVALNKSAAFDVCKTRHHDTFFDDWRFIKHNIITDWVDINDASANCGFALFTDHTTSYAFGANDPLGLVLAYAGKGLWNKTSRLYDPTDVHYAILPHDGDWSRGHIWRENNFWNEPLLAQLMEGGAGQDQARSLVRTADGTYVTTLLVDRSDLLIRLFNAEGDPRPQVVSLGFNARQADLIELDGRVSSKLAIANQDGNSRFTLAMPRFGIRTVRLSGCKLPPSAAIP